jgi:hypothetical protein
MLSLYTRILNVTLTTSPESPDVKMNTPRDPMSTTSNGESCLHGCRHILISYEGATSITQLLASQGSTLNAQNTVLRQQVQVLEGQGRMLESQRSMLEVQGRTLEAQGRMLEAQGHTLEAHQRLLESLSRTLEAQGRTVEGQHQAVLETQREGRHVGDQVTLLREGLRQWESWAPLHHFPLNNFFPSANPPPVT